MEEEDQNVPNSNGITRNLVNKISGFYWNEQTVLLFPLENDRLHLCYKKIKFFL